ncbi:CHAT domain-containing protein [Mycena latifolia]|nr:CHAT domain-containing protein [Mycena latifolia]
MSTRSVPDHPERIAKSRPNIDMPSNLNSGHLATNLESEQTHPDLAKHHTKLGENFLQQFKEQGDLVDLTAALANFQEAVNLTPKGHPDLAGLVMNISNCFMERYEKLGGSKDLAAALQRFQEAVELTPVGHPDKPGLLKDLGVYFLNRFQLLEDIQDLEAAFAKLEQAVELLPEGHPDVAGVVRHLGICFEYRYRMLGNPKDVELALQKIQEAVELTPHGHPKRSAVLQNLAACLMDRYHRLGDLEDLEAALRKSEEAVELTSKGHPDLPQFLHALGGCFHDRHLRLRDLSDLEAAFKAYQEAVKLTPDEHPNYPGFLHNLGGCFLERYRRLGNLEDLELALETNRVAVELTSPEHPDRAGILHDFGICFTERYQRLGDLNDLEAALQKYKEALESDPKRHSDLAAVLIALGGAFRDRYSRLGDLNDLEIALNKIGAVVELTPEGHPSKPGVLEHLAVCFRVRYQRLGNLEDLDHAFQGFQEAVDLTPKGHPDLARLLHNLGLCSRERCQRLGDLDHLEAALSKFHEVVELAPKGHPDRPTFLQNLAASLVYRYRQTGNFKDLVTGIEKHQEVVELTPKGHPSAAGALQGLAMSLSNRYRRRRDSKDLENVHYYYKASFDISSPTPELSWKAALGWAAFATKWGPPSTVLSAYSAAFKNLPEIIWIGHSVPVRHDALRRLDIGAAIANAVRISTLIWDLAKGIELMEQGMATVFQQTLQLKADVDQLSTGQQQNFRRLSFELYSEASTDPAKVLNTVNQRDQLLVEIRQQPGLEYFLRPKTYTILREASKGGPVVVLNSNQNGCDGIIIPNPTSDPMHVPLPNVTLDLLESHRATLLDALGRCNVRTRADSASTRLFGQQERFTCKSTEECFADILSWLWENVVSPVYRSLRTCGIEGGRLWWLPTGAFTGLPLHASAPDDQFIHSYTATLGSLLEAYAKKSSSSASKVGVVGVTHTGSRSLNYLQGVKREVQKIASIIEQPLLECLEGEKATPDAVRQQLQDCSWVHLACHGKQDLFEPTKSHLLLYGGILELETILRMPLSNAEFVFLAACQTAMGDGQLVNESFHLGGGFIAAGFRGAIGTLWSMNDQDGPLVADVFYSHLFRNGRKPQASDAAEALHLAVEELKKRNVPYERWVPFIHMGV